MRDWPQWLIIVILVVLVLCCCALPAALGVGGFWVAQNSSVTPFAFLSTNRPPILGPDLTATPTQEFNVQPVEQGAYDTLDILQNEIVPENDMRELAARLQGKIGIPLSLETPPEEYNVGDRKQFWASNTDTNDNFKVDAILGCERDHLYFWLEDGLNYDDADLQALCDAFESKIYPTNREFFGSEWTPGVDNDVHLYVLMANGLGSVGGYFSSADEVLPEAHEYSNVHEMFFLSGEYNYLSNDYTYGTLAHEFQHMIHFYRDRNEEGWLNEGFSELAAYLNQYDPGGMDYMFISNPDWQLNTWPTDSDQTGPSYGAAFLFVTYFLDRFGEEATKALVSDPQNGMTSVDKILTDLAATDPVTGEAIGADELFADWVVANYLTDDRVGDGRYYYHNYTSSPQADDTETIEDCPLNDQIRTVAQYGSDYIRFDCIGSYTLTFEGDSMVGVMPEDAQSGSYFFWSNKGDESDMTLTREFDFSSVSGPLTLKYWTWYDLEEDYDYVYVEVSEDGQNWAILKTPSGTDKDPSGNSYGWGYNGLSDGWIQESADLSSYAGKTIQVRFEYVTDAAVNGEGFLLEDVSIPETGYSTDFLTDEGGWQGEGFVRIMNVLPQTFKVSLIKFGDYTTVETLTIKGGEPVQIPITIGGDVRFFVMTVSGTTRFTRQPAQYKFSLMP